VLEEYESVMQRQWLPRFHYVYNYLERLQQPSSRASTLLTGYFPCL
jgi:hypothetical protein